MIKLLDNVNGEIACKSFTFPGGERHIVIEDIPKLYAAEYITIVCHYKSSDDIIDLALYVDAIRGNRKIDIKLSIPYFPYARQDRRANMGEAHSLKVISTIINSLEFYSVEVYDPHSHVTEALVNNLIIQTQEDLFTEFALEHNLDVSNTVLVSPDAGANKKTLAIAVANGIQTVVRADKIRDTLTGQITETKVYDSYLLKGKDVWVCDDICDGGRTFIELSKVILASAQVKSLNLFVTHGIFSKGLEALEPHFDSVYYLIDLRK